VRHSELKFFEDILHARQEQIKKNISGVEDEMSQLQGLELNDEGDYASAINNNLVESAIGSQQQKELLEIDAALLKIKERNYGICDMCEEDIGVQRLKVKPHAKYCIDCREIAEKNN
jgi:DnaK suppressor protein